MDKAIYQKNDAQHFHTKALNEALNFIEGECKKLYLLIYTSILVAQHIFLSESEPNDENSEKTTDEEVGELFDHALENEATDGVVLGISRIYTIDAQQVIADLEARIEEICSNN